MVFYCCHTHMLRRCPSLRVPNRFGYHITIIWFRFEGRRVSTYTLYTCVLTTSPREISFGKNLRHINLSILSFRWKKFVWRVFFICFFFSFFWSKWNDKIFVFSFIRYSYGANKSEHVVDVTVAWDTRELMRLRLELRTYMRICTRRCVRFCDVFIFKAYYTVGRRVRSSPSKLRRSDAIKINEGQIRAFPPPRRG